MSILYSYIHGCFDKLGVLFVIVLVMRALPPQVRTSVPEIWKLPRGAFGNLRTIIRSPIWIKDYSLDKGFLEAKDLETPMWSLWEHA